MRRGIAAAAAVAIVAAIVVVLAVGSSSTSPGTERVDLMLDFLPNADHAAIYAALAGSERRAEPVNAAATAKARAVRISNLHEFFRRTSTLHDRGIAAFYRIRYRRNDACVTHR